MAFKISGIVISDEGLKREQNEDNFSFFGVWRKEVTENKSVLTKSKSLECDLLAVFDGMGGEEAGEIASLIAAENITACPFDRVKHEGMEQIRKANQQICDYTQKLSGSRMGTTMVGIYFDYDKAICCNVGDSRGYLLRDKKLKLLSKDHSEGQRMVDAGFMTLEEAKKSKAWHTLSQNLGVFEDEFIIEPYYSEEISIRKGDLYMLCSDGVTDLLSDEEIESVLNKEHSLKAKIYALLDLVFARGAKDNTTIILAEVSEKWFS